MYIFLGKHSGRVVRTYILVRLILRVVSGIVSPEGGVKCQIQAGHKLPNGPTVTNSITITSFVTTLIVVIEEAFSTPHQMNELVPVIC